MTRSILGALIAVLFTGCMIGPDYFRPKIDTPASWRYGDNESRDIANTLWWQQFEDPVLDNITAEALRNNRDLRIAAARVEQFMGLYAETRSGLFPQVGTAYDESRQRITRENPNGVPPVPKFNNYQGLLAATWELDIWGRLRRETEAARAEILASEEARRAVVLTLVSAVADSYIELLNLDRQLEITRQTSKSREDTYRLFQKRYDNGVISDLELYQAKSEYMDTVSNIAAFEKLIARQEHSLCVLLGRNPGPIPRGKDMDRLALPAVPAGLPSELLERRPDIRQAEQDLIAANARIGAARAQYFPSITLTGFTGSESAHLSDLFSGPAHIWSYAGQATMPIFTAGRIAGSIKTAEAVQQQMLARYEQSIQNGFREVEDALVSHGKTGEQLRAKSEYVESLRTCARVARLRFEEGITSYIEVLDAERSLFSAELVYAQLHAEYFRTIVDLYKALGGGWVLQAEQLTAGTKPHNSK